MVKSPGLHSVRASRSAQLAQHPLTSMFYVQNWHLIGQTTDNLTAETTASPLQHFWSLSDEEQYYVAIG